MLWMVYGPNLGFSLLSIFPSPLFSASYFHEIYGKVVSEDFFPSVQVD